MKTKNQKSKAFVIALFCITLLGVNKIKAQQCTYDVWNSLSCGQSVTIDWYFWNSSSNTNCGFGSQTIAWNTFFTIPCPGGACSLPAGEPTNIYMAVTAIGGCTVTPVWVSNVGPNQVYLPCPGAPCPPNTCCDFGSIFKITRVACWSAPPTCPAGAPYNGRAFIN